MHQSWAQGCPGVLSGTAYRRTSLSMELFKVSILAPRIFEVVLYFCKICGPLM